MVANNVGEGPPIVPVMTSTEWLFGESLTARRIRTKDWSGTPLGRREDWPTQLRIILNVLMASKVPMVVLWGPALVTFHNDACIAIFAERAEMALGSPAPNVWPEAWHLAEPTIHAMMTSGQSLYRENVRFPLLRHGRIADAYFNLADTPIYMEDGTVGGVLVTYQETTAAVEYLRELENTQETLRTSQAYLEAAFCNMTEGIAIVDIHGQVVDCNDAFATICRFPDRPQCFKTFAEYPNLFDVFYTDGTLVEVDQWAVPRALRGEKITNAKYIFRRKDTGYEWLGLYSFAPIFDSAGQITACVVSVRDITEQDKTERALRASEAKYAMIAEKSPHALALTTLPGAIITDVNEAFCRLFEYSRDEVRGKTPWDLKIVDEEAARQLRNRIAKNEAIRGVETTRRAKNGRTLHVAMSIDPLPLASGTQVLVRVEDLTAQKEAEEAKRLYQETQIAEKASKAAEAKYRGIISVSADAIIVIDERQEIVEWNLGAEQIFGYSRLEMIGQPLTVVIPGKNRADHRVHVERFAHEKGAARKMDHSSAMGLHRAGREFPISATISRIRLGDQLLMSVSVRDITEEKRHEDELRILAEIGATLASLDYENTLQEICRIAAHALGGYALLYLLKDDDHLVPFSAASKDPEKAWCATVFLENQDTQPSKHPVWEIIRNRQGMIIPVTLELLKRYAKNPKHYEAMCTANPQCSLGVPLLVGDRCLGVVMVSTETRQYDARDLTLAQEIGRRIALFVENARLHQSEQSAIRMRDEVLSIVAHDLRNPLGVILLEAAKLLRASDADERVTKAMTSVDRSARRMHRIIEDLLDFVSFDSGQLSVDLSDESPAQLLTDAADAQAPLYARSGLPLEIHTYPGLPTISIDRHRILQVFQNLLGNALKFSTAGQKVILGAKQDQEKKSLLFWVEDHGRGIDADDLPRVFDRFFHGDTRRGGGTGLGLAIVKKIIEMHGGRVWVESEVGRGSTFYFTIPLPRAHAAKG